jgi:YidC/Oxa1 family membrane protein insertase
MSDLFNTPNDKGGSVRTVIAIALSVIVMTGGLMLTNALFPVEPSAQDSSAVAKTAAAPAAGSAVTAAQSAPATGIRPAESFVGTAVPAAKDTAHPAAQKSTAQKAAPSVAPPAVEQTYTVSTDLVEAVFTNKGGDLISLKLKKHRDQNGVVNLVLGPEGTKAFTVAFGGKDVAPQEDIMDVRMVDAKTIEFSKTYLADVPGKTAPESFLFKKTYSFKDGEYLFGLNIGFENSVNEYLPLDQGGFAYTLSFAPQIGPRYNPASKNSDYRKVVNLIDGKRKEEKLKATAWSPKSQPAWSGILGKYFVFLAVPELPEYSTSYSSILLPDLGQTTRIDLSRPAIKASKQSDNYSFYFGPKTSAELTKYNYADKNAFQKVDFRLDEAMDHSSILGPLESALKFILNLFYAIIPNYGIAILLVTLLVKALLFPLTKKGSISSAHMQELQPKMQALQDKYKDNPQKLNQEMAEFYKKENFNPMSGCLPLLIQMPIFFAMYNLFGTHFDLRGALFIPGWIPDLSAPETIWNFAPFKIPLLGWSDLRALPIIYLLSQIFYAKFTQQPQASGGASAQSQQMNMKLMMYGMPIVFFFILYDVPSGLLVYWIFSNVLTIAQQIVINDLLKKRKMATAVVETTRSSNPPVKKRK